MRVTWKLKFLFLLFVAVPAFSGYPLTNWNTVIIPGITWGWICYLFGVHMIVCLVIGSTLYVNILSAAALITLPVVFGGGMISYLFQLSGLGKAVAQEIYSTHYVSLCLTMLTVIPLAISGVVVIPVHTIEKNMLIDKNGVTRKEKHLLMFIRVFNHILFFVIPTILEVVREEKPFSRFSAISYPKHAGYIDRSKKRSSLYLLKQRLVVFFEIMTYLSVEAICAAVQYIPLWAVEIAQLPEKKRSV